MATIRTALSGALRSADNVLDKYEMRAHKAHRAMEDHYNKYTRGSRDKYGFLILTLPPTPAAIAHDKILRDKAGRLAQMVKDIRKHYEALRDAKRRVDDQLGWSGKVRKSAMELSQRRIAMWKRFKEKIQKAEVANG